MPKKNPPKKRSLLQRLFMPSPEQMPKKSVTDGLFENKVTRSGKPLPRKRKIGRGK